MRPGAAVCSLQDKRRKQRGRRGQEEGGRKANPKSNAPTPSSSAVHFISRDAPEEAVEADRVAGACRILGLASLADADVADRNRSDRLGSIFPKQRGQS